MRIASAWLNRLRDFLDGGNRAQATQGHRLKSDNVQLVLDKAFFRASFPVDVHIDVKPGSERDNKLTDCLSIQRIELNEKIIITLGHNSEIKTVSNSILDRIELSKRLDYLWFFNGSLNTLSNSQSSVEKVRFMRFITIKCENVECTLLTLKVNDAAMTATAVYDGYLQYSETGNLSTSLDAICECMNKVFQGKKTFGLIDPEKNKIKNRIRGFGADSSNNLELVVVVETIVDEFSQRDLISILETPDTTDGAHVIAVFDLSNLIEHADAYDCDIDPMCAAAVREIIFATVMPKHEAIYSAN